MQARLLETIEVRNPHGASISPTAPVRAARLTQSPKASALSFQQDSCRHLPGARGPYAND
jgi:hypothetical protein